MSLSEDQLAVLPPLPDRQGGNPVFHEPWHAQLFAMTVALNENGHFTWRDWASHFGAVLAASPISPGQTVDAHYFENWLSAFESFMEARGFAAEGQLADLQKRWDAAARSTPHGEPIHLAAQ